MSGAELLITHILFEQFEQFNKNQKLEVLTEHILDHLNVPIQLRDRIAETQTILRPAPILTIKQKSPN
jgi:predicted SAM-dependent methyltransferase